LDCEYQVHQIETREGVQAETKRSVDVREKRTGNKGVRVDAETTKEVTKKCGVKKRGTKQRVGKRSRAQEKKTNGWLRIFPNV